MEQHIIVMGVTGVGKSTLAAALAERLGRVYVEGDDFHTQDSVAKMAAGQPLDDEDRFPWLAELGTWIAAQDAPLVVSCSALKRVYRDQLRRNAPQSYFVHLTGDRRIVQARVSSRQAHFMPPSLIASQFATLEPLGADELGVTLDLAQPVDDLVNALTERIRTSYSR